jgi:FixJ family two-component response regulator
VLAADSSPAVRDQPDQDALVCRRGNFLNMLDALVFVIDDDPLVRSSVADLISSAGLAARTFASTPEFMSAERPALPSCLVLDVQLAESNGLDFQRQLLQAGIKIPIVFITGHGDIPMGVKAMRAGAMEFLTKPFRGEDLLAAIRLSLDRDREALVERAESMEVRQRFDSLTVREREVLHMVTSGLLNKQVAGELGVTELTVKVHRGRAMRKMKAGSFAELVRMVDRLKTSD